MNPSWSERPREHAALFNPAFLAIIIGSAAKGAQDAGGLSWPLAFLVAPLVLPTATRSLLPLSTTTSTATWLARHPQLRLGLADHAAELSGMTREGIAVALSSGAVSVAEGRLEFVKLKSRPAKLTEEAIACIKASEKVGKWLAKSPDVANTLSRFGVAP